MLNNTPRTAVTALLGLVLLALVPSAPSCSTPGSNKAPADTTGQAAQALRLSDTSTVAMGAPAMPQCPYVCLTEHTELATTYVTKFGVERNAELVPIPNPVVALPWEAFKNQVAGHYPGEGPRGVVFCYGLDTDTNFVLGINLVLLKKVNDQEYSFDSLDKATMYIVEAGKMKGISRKDWKVYADNYKSWTKVRAMEAGAPVRSLSDCDHLEYVMPWEFELMLLGTQTDPPAGTNVRFTSGAAGQACSAGGKPEYRQITMVSLEGYLSDDPVVDGHQFAHRAADLGTPCPPRCGKWMVTTNMPGCTAPYDCPE